MQYREQEHRDRAAEVQVAPDDRIGEQRGGLAQVTADGDAAVGLGEQGIGMRDDDRVVVDVGDASPVADLPGYLVDRTLGRQADADVQELADPRVRGQVADGQPQELAIGHGLGPGGRDEPDDLLGGYPVGLEVVLAAQVVVIHPRDVGNGRVHTFGATWHLRWSRAFRPRFRARGHMIGRIQGNFGTSFYGPAEGEEPAARAGIRTTEQPG